MKSQKHMMHELVQAFFKDAWISYPSLRGSFSKDLDRLSRNVEARGIGVFTLDLPNIDTILLEGLKTGRIQPKGRYSTVVSAKVKVPRFLSGLWLRIFDNDGLILEDVDPNAIMFIRQISLVGKKIVSVCTPQRIKDTVNEYYKVDSSLPSATLPWGADWLGDNRSISNVHFCDIVDTDLRHASSAGFFEYCRTTDNGDAVLLANLQSTCDQFAEWLGSFNPISEACTGRARAERGGRNSRLDLGMRHGPGAVAHGPSEVDKYDFRYASSKLRKIFPTKYLTGATFGEDVPKLLNHELPSRLIAVPKNSQKPRLIAAEPVEHQWFQQLTRTFLERRVAELLPLHITFRDQRPSQEAARLGSTSGSIATIDLSSASDRLSCFAIERCFRKNPSLLRALHASRTRYVKNSTHGDWQYLLLNKFATQGTAVTFPVQTLFFLMCVLSLYEGESIHEKIKYSTGTARVFGDDIAIATRHSERLYRLLSLLSLKVNADKSFATGRFRESCGADFFDGYDVTPTKPQRYDPSNPEGQRSLVDISNELHSKGYWNAAQKVLDHLNDRRRLLLPIEHVSRVQNGLASFCGSYAYHLKMRWNYHLSRVEFKFHRLQSVKRVRDRAWLSRFRKTLFELPHLRSDFTSDVLLRPTLNMRCGWGPVELL